MKLVGISILAIFIVIAVGSFLAPFAAIAYVIATNSLSNVIRYALIGYVCMIPISILASRA